MGHRKLLPLLIIFSLFSQCLLLLLSFCCCFVVVVVIVVVVVVADFLSEEGDNVNRGLQALHIYRRLSKCAMFLVSHHQICVLLQGCPDKG